jgi:hypothetical protein
MKTSVKYPNYTFFAHANGNGMGRKIIYIIKSSMCPIHFTL